MGESSERLTWEEIVEKYPDTWVGMVEIDWEDEVNIRSSVVKYTDKTKSELLEMQITGQEPNLFSRYTTPDHLFHVGVLG